MRSKESLSLERSKTAEPVVGLNDWLCRVELPSHLTRQELRDQNPDHDPPSVIDCKISIETFLHINPIVHEKGEVALVGTTGSSNYPTTPGAYDRVQSGSGDGFVSILDTKRSGAAQLVYSTLIGGSGSETLYDFEEFSDGDRLTNQLPGATFVLSDGDTPEVRCCDGGQQFPSGGPTVISNFPPGWTFPAADLEVTFTNPVNRVAFEIRNNINDDLIITVKCFSSGQMIDEQE